MNTVKILKHTLCIGLLSSSLTACSSLGLYNGANEAQTIAQKHPIKIQRLNTQADLKVQRTKQGIAITSNDDLQQIVDDYERANGGTVRITMYGQNAHNRQRLRAILSYLQRSGITEDSVLVKQEPVSMNGKSHVAVSFTTYSAQSPDCSNMWTDNSADAYRNTARKGFGCAHLHNLAETLVNPADLYEMRPFGYGIASRRAKVLDQFKSGSTKPGDVGAGGASASSGSTGAP